MTFIGPLMMHSNFSVTVDHVHIFSDFRLVDVHLCILNDSNEGQARLFSWAPLKTTIDTGRSRVAGGGAH
jgi:hypothetical protein